MIQLGPTIETERLLLRPPCAADFEPYVKFIGDEQTARFIGGMQPRAVAWRQLATLAGGWALHGFCMFSFIEKATGRWIGRGGPWMPEGWPGSEVGWGIVADAQRKGYAKEAATAAIDWVFDALGWTEVIHCIDPANTPSIAVAHSLGSSLLRSGVSGPPPYESVQFDIYGQSREAWRARR